MLNYSDCDQRLLDDVDEIVQALEEKAQIDPTTVMLVGAVCRDVIHSALGHDYTIRATTDTDIGLAISDWSAFERLRGAFQPIGDTAVRFDVVGHRVDVVPFGGVETPPGAVTPAPRTDSLVVFGFEDIYERSAHLELPGGRTIRIPQPAGYAALKMRAWIDRSVDGNDKDASDLAVAIRWYQESEAVRDALYDSDDGLRLLGAVDFDLELAATDLLALDIRGQLSSLNYADLVARWLDLDIAILARRASLPADATWTRDHDRRVELFRRLAL